MAVTQKEVAELAGVTRATVSYVLAGRAGELKITLGRVSEALSDDPEYVRDLKGKGMLRWDVRLAGRAAGAKAHLIEYSFQMKFAKDAHIGREAASLMKQMEEENIKVMTP